jgi:hypothetical protein
MLKKESPYQVRGYGCEKDRLDHVVLIEKGGDDDSPDQKNTLCYGSQ